MKDNNPAYGDVVIDGARVQNLPEDGELPNLRTVEFSETERVDDKARHHSSWMLGKQIVLMTLQSLE